MTTTNNKHIVSETLHIVFECDAKDSSEAYSKYLEAFGRFYDAIKQSGANLEEGFASDDGARVYKVDSDGNRREVCGWMDGTTDESWTEES